MKVLRKSLCILVLMSMIFTSNSMFLFAESLDNYATNSEIVDDDVILDKSEIEAESEVEIEAEIETESEIETETEAEIDNEVKVESETEIEIETESEIKIDTDIEAEVATESETEIESENEIIVETEEEIEIADIIVVATVSEVEDSYVDLETSIKIDTATESIIEEVELLEDTLYGAEEKAIKKVQCINFPKTVYNFNETIDVEGLKIRVTYEDNTTKDIEYNDETKNDFLLVVGLNQGENIKIKDVAALKINYKDVRIDFNGDKDISDSPYLPLTINNIPASSNGGGVMG